MTPNRLVESLLDEKPVALQDLIVPGGKMVCPHCQESIHEKGLGYRDGKHIHGACGGVVQLPAPSAAEQRWLDQFKSRLGSLQNPPAHV